VATTFLNTVYRLHGLPTSIISDRDLIFRSKFWQHLFKLAGTSLKMSSSYHPQTDGQSKRVNQCVEIFLRCFVHAYPRRWKYWLTSAEFWYNTSLHSSLGRSPFEALYGRQPRVLGIDPPVVAAGNLSTWLTERSNMTHLIKEHLNMVVVRMKRQANNRRSEREFSVGSLVYLKLQSYV
jgi:transposase InsO family protein